MISSEKPEFDQNKLKLKVDDLEMLSDTRPKRDYKKSREENDLIKKKVSRSTKKLGDLLYLSPHRKAKTSKMKKEDDSLPIYLRKALEKKSNIAKALSPTSITNRSIDKG